MRVNIGLPGARPTSLHRERSSRRRSSSSPRRRASVLKGRASIIGDQAWINRERHVYARLFGSDEGDARFAAPGASSSSGHLGAPGAHAERVLEFCEFATREFSAQSFCCLA